MAVALAVGEFAGGAGFGRGCLRFSFWIPGCFGVGSRKAPKPLDGAQQTLLEAARDVGALLGQAIAWRGSGGVCEGNNLYAAGLPNIDTLGVRGGDIHSEDEYAWPESFAERACLSAALLMKIASGEVDTAAIHGAHAAPS